MYDIENYYQAESVKDAVRLKKLRNIRMQIN